MRIQQTFNYLFGSILSLGVMYAFCLPSVSWAVGAVPKDHDPKEWILQVQDLLTGDKLSPDQDRTVPSMWYNTSQYDSVLVEVGKNVKIPNPSSYYAVTGIGLLEKSNNPCHLTLWGRMVDPRFRKNERKLAEFKFAKCTKVRPSDTSLVPEQITLSSRNDFKLASWSDVDDHFVRGIRNCRIWKKQPIPAFIGAFILKGVKLVSTKVGGNGKLTNRTGVRVAAQHHCPDDQNIGKKHDEGWDELVNCPDGQILTGVHVYHRNKAFVALGPRCKTVVSRKVQKQPVKDIRGY